MRHDNQSSELSWEMARDRAAPDCRAAIHRLNLSVATPVGTWARYDETVLAADVLWLARTGEQAIAGYAALTPSDYLAFFVIAPALRGGGRGTRFLLALLARQGGDLHLHVRASNTDAQRFYERLRRADVTVARVADGEYPDGDLRLRYTLSLGATSGPRTA